MLSLSIRIWGTCQVIELNQQEMHIRGEIHFNNAEAVYAQGLSMIQAQKNFPVVLNLAELPYSNTVALAVFIRWLRQTPESKGLVFKSVPEKMMKIIQSCHLTQDLQFSRF